MRDSYLISSFSGEDITLESENGYIFSRAGSPRIQSVTEFAYQVYRSYYGPCPGWTGGPADLLRMMQHEQKYASSSFHAICHAEDGRLFGSMRITAWDARFVFPAESYYGITIRSRAFARQTKLREWGHSSQIAVDENGLVSLGYPQTTTSRRVFRGLIKHCARAAYINGINFLLCEFDKPMEWVFRRLGVVVNAVTEEIDPDFLGGSRVCEVDLGSCWSNSPVKKLLGPYYSDTEGAVRA